MYLELKNAQNEMKGGTVREITDLDEAEERIDASDLGGFQVDNLKRRVGGEG